MGEASEGQAQGEEQRSVGELVAQARDLLAAVPTARRVRLAVGSVSVEVESVAVMPPAVPRPRPHASDELAQAAEVNKHVESVLFPPEHE